MMKMIGSQRQIRWSRLGRLRGSHRPHVLVLMRPGTAQERVVDAIERAGARAVMMEEVTDLVVYPAEIAVIDPGLLSIDDWNDLRELYAELNEATVDLMLVRPSTKANGLPPRRLVSWPGLFNRERLVAFLRDRCQRGHQRRA